MGYYSRHSIFLKDNDRQKLTLIQKLLEEENVAFDIREETVYLYDGESITVPCVSDENWYSGFGYKWYDFEYDMKKVSEKFNRQYPDEVIEVYVKTEDGFKIHGAYTFIGYNVFELYSDFNKSFTISRSLGHCSRNYNNIPGRIKALQILYDNLVERRMAGRLREAALGLEPINLDN